MSNTLIKVTGLEALNLGTQLLQRARLADPRNGVWEAADVQWSWRQPRRSDDVEKLFWLDDHGPIAGVFLPSSRNDNWQCDLVFMPGSAGPPPAEVWQRAMEHAQTFSPTDLEVPIEDDDVALQELVKDSGFSAGDSDSTAWMNTTDRPKVVKVADGFTITNRSEQPNTSHPMTDRCGDAVGDRLKQCSLYDPELDLAVESTDGKLAGYSLYWFDPVTKVGLVEPVRVEDEFQRRGLATAMLTIGIEQLAQRGAEGIKVSYSSEHAGRLYESVGFKTESTTTWYRSETR